MPLPLTVGDAVTVSGDQSRFSLLKGGRATLSYQNKGLGKVDGSSGVYVLQKSRKLAPCPSQLLLDVIMMVYVSESDGPSCHISLLS